MAPNVAALPDYEGGERNIEARKPAINHAEGINIREQFPSGRH
jgi:hypothetical protein